MNVILPRWSAGEKSSNPIWAVTILCALLALSATSCSQDKDPKTDQSKKQQAAEPEAPKVTESKKPKVTETKEPKVTETKAPKVGETKKPTQSKLIIRVNPRGWGDAGVADIKKVLESAGNEIWRLFPDRQLKPIDVRRSAKGPMVLFKRGPNGRYQVLLDTGDLYWSQYSFQFAHELCHILCNYRDSKNPNKWFEESLCELASLFAMRQMAKTWKTSPPYPHWKGYASSLHKYAQKRIDAADILVDTSLAQWYQQNEAKLRAKATVREKNNVVAVALLPLFEAKPTQWQAISYLNKGKAEADESFAEYLRRWQTQAPKKHKPFIARIAKEFGVSLD